MSLNDRLKQWFALFLFADIAHAQFGPPSRDVVETVRFTITEKSACTGDCFSDIFFLPGFQASRLYQLVRGSEEQRWEPGLTVPLQADAPALLLDEDGESINDIYTRADAAIDHVGPSFKPLDIYQSFLQMLEDLKTGDPIADFSVFPYDWRIAVNDIIENGTMYDNGIHFPATELEALAATSKMGKVTIVAHSNGGLVAKALMRKLEAEGKANLINKIIFIGTPQLGTPKTAASILHGDFQDLFGGFLLRQSNARALGENMSGAFGLLPSAEYFARVAEPVVDTTNAPSVQAEGGLSDLLVETAAEFAAFLIGAGGRTKPAKGGTESPGILSAALLADSVTLHTVLDTWTPPPGVEVFQIAGWGRDTA